MDRQEVALRTGVFPKSLRLRRRAEYLAVQKRGRSVSSDHVIAVVAPAGRTTGTRVGITVSSKVGCAVVRNRIKRWIREYVRRHKQELPPVDFVLIARVSAAAASHVDLDRDLARVLRRIGGGGAPRRGGARP